MIDTRRLKNVVNFSQLRNILTYSTISHLQADSRILQDIFFTCYCCSYYSSMVNGIYQGKYFSSQPMQKMRQGG